MVKSGFAMLAYLRGARLRAETRRSAALRMAAEVRGATWMGAVATPIAWMRAMDWCVPDVTRTPQALGPADARGEAELLKAVSGIIDGLRRIHGNAVDAYRPEVEAIIQTGSRSVDRIEHTLHGLLAFCGDDAALALFKRLCRYYWDLDPEATARHVFAYREWFDSDGTRGRAVGDRPHAPMLVTIRIPAEGDGHPDTLAHAPTARRLPRCSTPSKG